MRTNGNKSCFGIIDFFLMLAGVAAIAYLGFTLLLRLIAAVQGASGA